MEIVHKEVLGRIDKQDSKLGWRFLDKFIQLPLVMPRLSERQKDAYLASLFGADLTVDQTNAEQPIAAEANRIRAELASGELGPDEAAQLVGELNLDPLAFQSRDVREAAEDVIALGARDFSDADPEIVSALRRRLPYLSDNPRTIKRTVNLYRFYRFIAWAREASSPDLEAAAPELIASWAVVAARWPQVVHWLQVHGRRDENPEVALRQFWQDDEPELCAFIDSEKLDLNRALSCGLW